MSVLTCMNQMASLQHPATHSSPRLSIASQFCLYYEWVVSSILAGVFGKNQWCLAPAEITGARGRLSSWIFQYRPCEVPSTPKIYVPMYRGRTEWLSSLCFFSCQFYSHGLPMTAASRWLTGSRNITQCSWFHSAQEESLPLDVWSRSIKNRLFSSVTPGKAHKFLPPVGMATGWHTDSPRWITASAQEEILS